MHHDPSNLGLFCLVKKKTKKTKQNKTKPKKIKTPFSDLRIQSWIFLKKRAVTDSKGFFD